MTDVKIDEKYLTLKAKNALGFVDMITGQIKIMTDKKADIFERYMSHFRINAILRIMPTVLNISKDAFVSGHNLNSELLNTDKAKEHAWDTHKLEHDDFFCTEEQEKMDEAKETIGNAIVDALKKVVKENEPRTEH